MASMNKYERELHLALRLARRAGTIAMRYYRRKSRVIIKHNETPVTAADRMVERTIVDGLLAVFPNDSILGEEHGVRHGSDRRFWAIDPIDGTSQFIAKTGNFCTMISLIVDGRPVVGVVAAPAHRTVYYAMRGHGAHVLRAGRRRSIKVSSKVTKVKQAKFAGPAGSKFPPSSHSQKIRSLILPKKRIPIGSAGLELCQVAEGRLDATMLTAIKLGLWDAAAGEVILKEAGGLVTNIYGRPLSYNRHHPGIHSAIIGAAPGLHRDIIAQARKHGVPKILSRANRDYLRSDRKLARKKKIT